ncbi:MAG TPA: TrkA family potassium uptake protein [Candidatus Methylomirabilis sp.]|nr:TrkA family potassium uptake protein [Candidatus Methylomirabilis sp.]
MKRFLVIGLGRFGRAVAEELTEAGAEVIGLDENMTRVEAVRDRIAVAAQVDSVDPEALKAVGAAEVDAAVVAIGENFEAEVLTVAALKELGIKEIVARAQTERERRILELVGATRVFFVELEMGRRLAKALAATQVVDHVAIAEGISLIHWTADERVVGKTLDETELRSRWGLNLVAVKRSRSDGAESVAVMPDPDFALMAGDVLLLVGADARIRAFTSAT